MVRIYGRIALIFLSLSVAPSASALVFGQLLMGQRTAEAKMKNADEAITGLKATEYELGVYVDPIPMIPVAAGLYYSAQTYDVDPEDENFAADAFGGNQIGFALMAWSPVGFFNIKPYAKFGYTFMGTYDYVLEGTAKLEGTFSVKGTHIGIGLRWEPIAFVGALLEFEMGNETLTADEIKFGAIELEGDDYETTVKSTAIRLGVQAGI